MKRIAALLLFVALINNAHSQSVSGTVIRKIVNSNYLKNTAGENPNRKISVYLPPGYEQSKKRYPVIYYLHGFGGTDSIAPNMKIILDLGIARNKIRPYILVIADNYTALGGSFYSNSALTGNWIDFEAK